MAAPPPPFDASGVVVADLNETHQAGLHAAAARPVAPLVMLLLALPAVLVVPRGGGSPATAALGFGLGVLYLFAGGLLGALGEAGLLPPALAAWAAPVGFATAGAVRLVRSEEG